MSDRIFSNGWESIGGEAETQRVNWDRVAETMAALQGNDLPAATPTVKTASKAEPTAPARVKKYAKVEMCEECGVPHPCTHDLVAARMAGDEEKYASLLEQRKNRREAAIANYEAMEREAAMAERANLRRAIYSALAEEEERLTAEAGKDCECGGKGCKACNTKFGGFCTECKSKPCKCEGEACDEKTACNASAETDGFVAVSAMNDAQKTAFASFAEGHGWPKEYVEAMLSRPVAAELPEAFRKVASSALAETDKRDIVTSMYKEAKLTDEQASRIKAYWRDELGYQDVEWIDDLVAAPAKE